MMFYEKDEHVHACTCSHCKDFKITVIHSTTNKINKLKIELHIAISNSHFHCIFLA